METKNPTLVDQHVSSRLRWRREELKLSQQDLADQLGVTFQQVQKYERGANRISAGRLFDLAKVLDTRITYFFDGLDAVSAGARRGAAEEGSNYAGQVDQDAVDLMVAYQNIHDLEARKSILNMVKKQSRPPRPEKTRAKAKPRSSKT